MARPWVLLLVALQVAVVQGATVWVYKGHECAGEGPIAVAQMSPTQCMVAPMNITQNKKKFEIKPAFMAHCGTPDTWMDPKAPAPDWWVLDCFPAGECGRPDITKPTHLGKTPMTKGSTCNPLNIRGDKFSVKVFCSGSPPNPKGAFVAFPKGSPDPRKAERDRAEAKRQQEQDAQNDRHRGRGGSGDGDPFATPKKGGTTPEQKSAAPVAPNTGSAAKTSLSAKKPVARLGQHARKQKRRAEAKKAKAKAKLEDARKATKKAAEKIEKLGSEARQMQMRLEKKFLKRASQISASMGIPLTESQQLQAKRDAVAMTLRRLSRKEDGSSGVGSSAAQNGNGTASPTATQKPLIPPVVVTVVGKTQLVDFKPKPPPEVPTRNVFTPEGPVSKKPQKSAAGDLGFLRVELPTDGDREQKKKLRGIALDSKLAVDPVILHQAKQVDKSLAGAHDSFMRQQAKDCKGSLCGLSTL